MEGARRILVIRLGAIGDVVRTMAVLRPLRRLVPEARICWVAEERPATLLHEHPLLDEAIVLPRKLLTGLFASPDTFFQGLSAAGLFAKDLRRRGFDLALDFHGTFKSGLVSLASGAPVRYGYAPPGSKELNNWFNTHHVRLPSRTVHRVTRNLALVRALGAPEDPVEVTLPIGARQRERVARWLREKRIESRRRIILYPGTSLRQSYKRYPASRLAVVAGELARVSGTAVIVAGGPGEEHLVQEVAGEMGGRCHVAPDLDLLELAELIRTCELFIGPDTGPMHIAWAVGTRVLALFGPTDPALNAPWGSGHSVLYNGPHPRRQGVIWPAAEQVTLAAMSMISETSHHREAPEEQRSHRA
jgi:ADP-heptose:LPS heptosyltransferase